ncbi:unnamed protein product [Lampetra planeri]
MTPSQQQHSICRVRASCRRPPMHNTTTSPSNPTGPTAAAVYPSHTRGECGPQSRAAETSLDAAASRCVPEERENRTQRRRMPRMRDTWKDDADHETPLMPSPRSSSAARKTTVDMAGTFSCCP